jgi:hypothetical protein
MFELIAAIQSVDPPSLVLWGLALFAAGMYPIGFMLGASCSPCCDPCGGCVNGTLPDTVTVTLSGWDDANAQGSDLISLTISSDFGSGAAARATAPGDTPGPITAVSVTDGGEGYARIARVTPTVTASASGGSGVGMSVTLSQTTDNAWQYDGRAVWQVASVSVTAGGTGYTDGQSVSFTNGTGGTTLAGASAVVKTNRVMPTVTASVNSTTGSGAALGVTLSQTTDWNGDAVWSVSALPITSAGSGYVAGDTISTAVTDGVQPEWDGFYAEVSSVGDDGEITAIAIYYGGEYYKSGGVVQSVVVFDGGAYYKEDASVPAESATVSVLIQQLGPQSLVASGASLVAVIDTNTSSGTSGQITGLTITSAGDGYLAWQTYSVECCEDYYNDLTLVLNRDTRQASNEIPQICTYSHRICGVNAAADSEYWEEFLTARVYVVYRGPSLPPQVIVSQFYGSCGATLTADEPITDCSSFSFTASDINGRTAVVTAGGDYDVTDKAGNWKNCFRCCRGEEESPDEIEVDVWPTGPFFVEGVDEPTTLVLTRAGGGGNGGLGGEDPWNSLGSSGRWSLIGTTFQPRISVWIEPCRNKDNSPSIPWCDSCWDSCQVRARAQYTGSGPTLIFYDQPCVSCADGTMCQPPTGEIVLDQIWSPGGGNDGNTAWNVEVL